MELPTSHFKRVWRDKFAKSISKFGKESVRSATKFLTGHCELNYHINKYKPNKIPKTCPHCLMEEETVGHFVGRCPKCSSGLNNERLTLTHTTLVPRK